MLALGGLGLVGRGFFSKRASLPRISRGPEGGVLIEGLHSPTIVTHVTAEETGGGGRIVAALDPPLVHLQYGRTFIRVERLQSLHWERADDHKPASLPADPRWGIVYQTVNWQVGAVR